MFILTSPSRFEQDIKKSRFLALAAPVSDEAEAKAFIAENSDRNANHNCWAWRIGQNYRFNDDGEPSGTAGKPILQTIDGQQLTNIVVLVTRWFGGILLGSGGLVRAYGGTAALCLNGATKERVIPSITVVVDLNFSDHASIKARLPSLGTVAIIQETFTGDGASLYMQIPEENADAIVAAIRNLTSGRASLKQQ
ncbi:hypothetical protein ASD54_23280 [Rhizobium sp. Root149]|uniref:IMPACT family protein n=1 Tax=Rhizobium sp. Root149 TaxID=1736473 RepID=UPI0007125D04|nr:YigZ family protein [Rhizobium sp. Root149]KQZ60512.1 hypothetical protein ASD54_23280 [Rhizobium sp. Root149]